MDSIAFDEFPYQSTDGTRFYVDYGYRGDDETPFRWSIHIDQAEKEYYMAGGFQDMVRYFDREGLEVEKVQEMSFWTFKEDYPKEWRAFILRLCKKHFSWHEAEVKPINESKSLYKSLQPEVIELKNYKYDSAKTSRVKRQA